MLEPEADATVAGLIAARVHMTEGQLYTAVLAVIVAVLLTLTGLPTAHEAARNHGSPAPAGTVSPSGQP